MEDKQHCHPFNKHKTKNQSEPPQESIADMTNNQEW